MAERTYVVEVNEGVVEASRQGVDFWAQHAVEHPDHTVNVGRTIPGRDAKRRLG